MIADLVQAIIDQAAQDLAGADQSARLDALDWVRGQMHLLYEYAPADQEGMTIADACDILGLDLAEEHARLLSLAAMADLSPMLS